MDGLSENLEEAESDDNFREIDTLVRNCAQLRSRVEKAVSQYRAIEDAEGELSSVKINLMFKNSNEEVRAISDSVGIDEIDPEFFSLKSLEDALADTIEDARDEYQEKMEELEDLV